MSKLITLEDFKAEAAHLDIPLAGIRAIDFVETNGSGGFLPSGRPKILFEGHYFHRLTGGKFDKSHPTLSYKKWTKVHYKGGEREWERLEEAIQLDRRAAYESASWGRFQILGYNHEKCGYADPVIYVQRMFEHERFHLMAFGEFIKRRGLIQYFRKKNIPAIAKGYNGTKYRENEYDVKLHNAWSRFEILGAKGK